MDENKEKTPVPARRGRTLRIVLVLSLALNLLVLGVMAGAFFRAGQVEHPRHTASDLRALWWALPDEARRDLRGALDPRDGDALPVTPDDRRARAAARHDTILTLLRAEPFDVEAFATAIQDERSERAERIDRAHAAFVARVVALSPGERAAMAERLESGRDRRQMRR